MKYSTQIRILGYIFFVIGLALIIAAISVVEANPAYQSPSFEFFALFVIGFGLMVYGVGHLGNLGYILRLEKKVSEISPLPNSPSLFSLPRVPSPTKIFCYLCGTENAYEANFCSKCGKKLAKTA